MQLHDKLKIIANAFCPTGKGGGVDPSCSPNSSAQIDTPAFKKWFGDSKVVDDSGKPLVVYHGTNADFDAFDKKQLKSKSEIKGFFFAVRKEFAEVYDAKNLIQAHVKISNPATFKDVEKIAGSGVKTADLHKHLIKLGYDGIFDKKQGIVVAFEPTQIKSATGNKGTFNPKDPIITHSANTHACGTNCHVHNSNGRVHNAKAKQLRRTFNKKPVQRKLSNKKSPTRIDPTRLATLRRVWTTDLKRRFKSIDKALYQLLVVDDAFGLNGNKVFNQQSLEELAKDYQCGFNWWGHAIAENYDVVKEIERAAKETDRNPSEAQRKAGTYRKGKVWVQGLEVAIESPRGSTRSGIGADGKPWSTTMKHHYGYIKLTESEADGDHIDCFLGPNPSSDKVFIVDQTRPCETIENAFCPTGPGGGQDNSCSPQFYHGTSFKAAKKILKEGLKVSRAEFGGYTSAGPGIYATKDLALAKMFGSSKNDKGKYAIVYLKPGMEPNAEGVFTKDIPPNSIAKIEVYQHKFSSDPIHEHKLIKTLTVNEVGSWLVAVQLDTPCREFDEHKCMIGWESAEEAKQAYHDNFSEGWQGFSGITEMTMQEFKQWLKEGDSSKPVMNYISDDKIITHSLSLNEKLQLLAKQIGTLVVNSSYFAECERDEKGHCLPSGEVGDKSSSEESKTPESSKEESSAGKFDRAKWQGKREEWGKLSVGQRDNLADAENSVKSRVNELLKGVQERPNTGDLSKDLETRIGQLSNRVHPQAADRMKTVARDYTNLMNEAGVKPEHQHALAMEAVDHLAAQESETMARQLGDHGVAHIKGDIDVAMQTLNALPTKSTAQDKLAAYTACIYHDTGYLTEPSRSFLDEGHPRWSEQYYNTNIKPTVAKALGERAANEVSHIIRTHDATDMDWNSDSVASSVRLADNLAVFHREKLPPVFRYVNGNIDVLKDLGSGKIDKATANERMVANIDKSNLTDKVKSQLRLGAKEVSEYTPKVTLGMLGGTLTGIKYKEGTVVAEVKESKKATEINKLGDFGQNQLAKLAKTFDADPKQFQKDLNFTFKGKDGRTRLRIEMQKAIENMLLNAGERFHFQTSPEQVNSFRQWIAKILKQHLLDEEVSAEDQWFEQYVEEGYRRGAGRAFDDTRPAVKKWLQSEEANKKLDFYDGTRADFLRSSFARPVSVEKVKLLAGRSFTDLKGISDQMSAKLTRGLTDGLVQGKNSKQIYKDLAKDVGISESRARAIAQTELTRAHSSGQIQSFKDLGVTKLGVMAEWKTADDDRVCDACDAMNGAVMTVDEAEGMIPRHPNCFIGPHTNIYTANGWKGISTIEVGDLVLTHLGRFQKVIQTHRNMGFGELVVDFKINWGGALRKITVTGGHPIRVGGKWVAAQDIKPGDKVHWLSSNCKGCGAVIPFGLKYCNVDCQWLNKEHRANISKKNSEANIRQYASGERDGHASTEAAHNRVRELVAAGLFIGGLATPRGDANPSKTPEARRKNSESKMGDKNPMRRHPEIAKANGLRQKQYYAEHPEKHPNAVLAARARNGDLGVMTYIERRLHDALLESGIKCVYNHRVVTNDRDSLGRPKHLWVDLALVKRKIAVECDGEYWHQDKVAEIQRDKMLEECGWTVLHFTGTQINETPRACASKVKRVLNNHKGKYKFALFEVAEVSHRKSGRVVLYNLSVAEDESYIAKGCVVHNCRCALLPANVGEEDDKDNDQIRGKSAIEKAIEDSLEAEGRGDKTTWPGADISISKTRPQGIFNSREVLFNQQQEIIIERLDQLIDLANNVLSLKEDDYVVNNTEPVVVESTVLSNKIVDLVDDAEITVDNTSFFAECERDEHGHCLPEGSSGSKSQLATRTYKPSTVEKQRKGEAEQLLLAKAIKGINTDDNQPFDIIKGKNGIEVKTLMDNNNDKITVHPESRIRKEKEAKKLNLEMHTVAIDTRAGHKVYYYKKGVGAFRISSMQRVSLSQLQEMLS